MVILHNGLELPARITFPEISLFSASKSVRQSVRSAKSPFDKVSVGKVSVRQNVFRQNVRVPYHSVGPTRRKNVVSIGVGFF